MSQQDSSRSVTRTPDPRLFKLNRLSAALLAGALLGLGASSAYAEIGPYTQQQRAIEAYKLRVDAAKANRMKKSLPHPDNGDEARYPSRINSYSKGLPHDALGVVSPSAYDALIRALSTGENADFEAIPLGVPNGSKQRDPQAGFTYFLEGRDVWSYTMPAAPAFSSAQQASESIEVLWQALTRDVHFSNYATDPLTLQAAADLSRFSDFRGPKAGGQVTPGTLFRGIAPGELNGPYLSQFLWRPVPFGATTITQRYNVPMPNNNHLTNYNEWLAIQNGASPSGITPVQNDGTPRYLRNNRDMAQYVLRDFNAQSYMNAAFIINSFGSGVFADSNPLNVSLTQGREPMWGLNHVLDLVSRVAVMSQSMAWYQKYQVHRRARPEVFFGRVHNHLTGAANYPINAELLSSPALSLTNSLNGTFLLPMATPAGSPLHPSYPAGHATMAGAAVTILKAYFKGSFVIPNPVVPNADGTALIPYSGPALTIEGELNKLATNIAIGRDAAGVHFRSDGDDGLALGEEMAISLLSDYINTYHEDHPGFTFNKFDGTSVTISKRKDYE